MGKTKATERLGIRVTPELRERISKRAEEEGRTKSNFVVKVLQDYLDRIDEAKKTLSK